MGPVLGIIMLAVAISCFGFQKTFHRVHYRHPSPVKILGKRQSKDGFEVIWGNLLFAKLLIIVPCSNFMLPRKFGIWLFS